MRRFSSEGAIARGWSGGAAEPAGTTARRRLCGRNAAAAQQAAPGRRQSPGAAAMASVGSERPLCAVWQRNCLGFGRGEFSKFGLFDTLLTVCCSEWCLSALPWIQAVSGRNRWQHCIRHGRNRAGRTAVCRHSPRNGAFRHHLSLNAFLSLCVNRHAAVLFLCCWVRAGNVLSAQRGSKAAGSSG